MTRKMLCGITACLLAFSAHGALRWKPDGTVRDARAQVFRSELTQVVRAFEAPEGLYLAGSWGGADRRGVALVARDLSSARYWRFELDVTDFFRYRDQLYLRDIGGGVFVRVGEDWKVADWRLAPDSVLLQPDADRELIVCSPAPMTKQGSGTYRGDCRSLTYGWQQELNWGADSPPRICADYLAVLGWQAQQRHVFRVRLSDGVLLGTKVLPRQLRSHTLDPCASRWR